MLRLSFVLLLSTFLSAPSFASMWDHNYAPVNLARQAAVSPAAPSGFAATSAEITNPYAPLEVGQELTYRTYGWTPQLTFRMRGIGAESIDGVNCLIVAVSATDGNVTFEDRTWAAQDTSGNVWALHYQDSDGRTTHYGVANALLLYSASPAPGDLWASPDGEQEEVTNTGVLVQKLSTGLGPYPGCLETTTDDDQGGVDRRVMIGHRSGAAGPQVPAPRILERFPCPRTRPPEPDGNPVGSEVAGTG